jgi:hypothetical protein
MSEQKRRLETVPSEKSQMEMFQEDLYNSLLGQVLVKEQSTDNENAEENVEEADVGGA